MIGGFLLADAATPAATTVAAAEDGRTLVMGGMRAFKEGRVDDSVKMFDQAADVGYPNAMLWQRGLSLYYADRFKDGAMQFRKDVEMNPNDTEESIWAMLCEARLDGFDAARKQMLVVGRDSRPVMRTVYSLFRGEDEAASLASLEKSATSGRGSDEFYAAMYLGLFAEAKSQEAEAKRWMQRAVSSEYGKGSGDYMAALASVHVQLRGWGSAKEL